MTERFTSSAGDRQINDQEQNENSEPVDESARCVHVGWRSSVSVANTRLVSFSLLERRTRREERIKIELEQDSQDNKSQSQCCDNGRYTGTKLKTFLNSAQGRLILTALSWEYPTTF